MNKENRRERWREALHDKAINVQLWSGDEPTRDDGFLTITLINHKGKMHKFVVTNNMKMLLDRQTKYLEFFSTDSQGRKTGVSLEWKPRDQAWLSDDKKVEEIRKMVQEQVKENPEITRQDGAQKDFGLGMADYYE